MQNNVKNIEEVIVEFTEQIQLDSYDFKLGSDMIAEDGAIPHSSLFGNDFQDQHPIDAITGLKDKLDEIESLKTVYSDKRYCANYYEWEDGNSEAENRFGLFVSLNGDKISICSGNDIFGIIVDSAAFVGGQANDKRDSKYGLVATTGAALIRCELEVVSDENTGSDIYVISNSYGVAKRVDCGYGYKVISFHYIDNEPYALINLTTAGDKIYSIGSTLQGLNTRMENAEFNITSAVNVANEAYKRTADVIVISGKVDNVVDTVDKVVTDVENLGTKVSNAESLSARAEALATSAANSAISMKNDAVKVANEAVSGVSTLRNDFTTMAKQINDANNKVSIVTQRINGYYEIVDTITNINKQKNIVYYAQDTKEYYYYDYDVGDWRQTTNPRDAGITVAVAGIQVETDENSSKINDLVLWEDESRSSIARIERKADANGAYIQSTVANINKYVVGEYSQAYGFTIEQSKNTFENGIIYVPTKTKVGNEAEVYEQASGDSIKQEFSREFYYEWNEDKWVESGRVAFSNQYFIGSTESIYWYVDTIDDVIYNGVTYKSYTLYKWEPYSDTNGKTQYQWIAVATPDSSVQSRAISNIRQDSNKIETSVVSLEGSYAGLQEEITDTKAIVDQLSLWKDGETEKMASVRTETSEDGGASVIISALESYDGEIKEMASLTLNVVKKDIGGEPTSSLVIDADNVNLDSYVTITDLKTGGKTEIDGNNITTGLIKSSSYMHSSGVYSDSGTAIDLNTGYIRSKNFAIDDNGDAYFTGKVVANEGEFNGTVNATNGNFTNGIFNNCEINNNCIIRGTLDGATGNFTGKVVANEGDIGGWSITEEGIVNTNTGITRLVSSNANKYLYKSLVTEGRDMPARFCVGFGTSETATESIKGIMAYYNQESMLYEALYDVQRVVSNVSVVAIKDRDDNEVSMEQIENMQITYSNNNTTFAISFTTDGYATISDEYDGNFYTVYVSYDYKLSTPQFCVLADGSLYTSACRMRGANSTIDISSNGLQITSDIMNGSQCEISAAGLYTYTSDSNSTTMPTRMVFGALQNEIGASVLSSSVIGLFIGSNGNLILRGPTGVGLLSNSSITIDAKTICKITADNKIMLNDELHANTVNEMYGTWELNGAEMVASDRNLKHDICLLDDRYNDLFDQLQPIKFKYNDGASNRYHTGFVAQDVCYAIEQSGLDTNELAAYVKSTEVNEDGTRKEKCGLRYDEFVALNTWQIQKVKTRISALEDRIKLLEEYILKLEKN